MGGFSVKHWEDHTCKKIFPCSLRSLFIDLISDLLNCHNTDCFSSWGVTRDI